MVEKAKREGVRVIAAAGTAGLRIASQTLPFSAIETIRNRTGLTVEVISGEEEARLAFVAARSGLGPPTAGTLVVFDTGGGSSQFTFGHRVGRGGTVQRQCWCRDPTPSVSALIRPYRVQFCKKRWTRFRRTCRGFKDRSVPDILVGMGGAITNIAAVKHGLAKYDPDIVQGTVPGPCRDRPSDRALSLP